MGASILAALGVRRARLITNNPAKYGGLQGYDLEIVGRVAPPAAVNPANVRYLRTKRDRLGHALDLRGGTTAEWAGAAAADTAGT